jgi:tetratricopeptide (TPR) repeat protein
MPRLILLAVLSLLSLAAPARGGELEEGLALFGRAAEARAREGEGATESRDLFRSAAAAWRKLAEAGTVSTRLYTNIGNAHAFAGDLGEAVLAYRRALVVDPENDRARDALDAIRAELGVSDRAEDGSVGLLRALFFWHDAFSPGTRRALFGALWVIGIAGLLIARRARRLRLPAAIVTAAAVAVLVSLAVTDRAAAREADAVLMVRTEGRAGDGEFYSASHSSPLPAGVELKLLERRGGPRGWVHGRLRDGTTSWVPAAAVTVVVPPR